MSPSAPLSELNIISNFETNIIKPNNLALNHCEYLRKENCLFPQHSRKRNHLLHC